MRLKIWLGIILVLAVTLQGCGRKGPLTLPKSAVSGGASVAVAAIAEGGQA